MSKRLILVLALAIVAAMSFAAYAEVQNLKVSGDITSIGVSRNLDLRNGKVTGADEGNKTHGIITIARVKVDADLTDNVMTTVRLLNERYWGTEIENVGSSNASNTNIALDLAYVTLKEFLYSPLSVTVGRQELHIGSELIVGDPDTNLNCSTASALSTTNGDRDLSARKAFDAVRLTLNYDPLVVEGIYAVIDTASSTGSKDETKAAQTLTGVTAAYKVDKATNVEAYFFDKTLGRDRTSGLHKSVRTDVLGGRVVNTSVSNLVLSLEAAWQFGTYANAQNQIQNRSAWALETSGMYTFAKMKYTPTLALLYNYFKGDNGGTSNNGNKAWDPMYENQKCGDIANAHFAQSNAHIIGGIVTAKPKDDIGLKAEYYAYWWAKAFAEGQTLTSARANTFTMTQRRFAGQELDVTGTYEYTEDVSLSLMGGWFFPGPSFAKYLSNDAKKKVGSEVIGSMKVTF